VKTALLSAFLCMAVSVVAQSLPSVVGQSQDCSPRFEKKISIKVPTVFTGTLEDDKNTSIAMKGIVLTGLDKKAPPVSQAAVTDSKGAFHFDSVPAGKYAITIDFTGVSVKKSEVHCATPDSCRVSLVVKSVTPQDCYRPKYLDRGQIQ
jgi:hypothetical protein